MATSLNCRKCNRAFKKQSSVQRHEQMICRLAPRSVSALYDALVAAGHDVKEWEHDAFALRSYAQAIGFQAETN